MKKLKDALLFILTYISGIVLMVPYGIARLAIMEIWYKERFPKWEPRMIVAINHPSLLEAIFAPLLFFREWIFRPLTWGPWNTPDKTNMKLKWYWFFWLALGRAVAIPRNGNRSSLRRAVARVQAILRSGGRVIIFPEGGRTWKGGTHILSPVHKKRLRPLKHGIGRFVARTGASVLPIWVEYAPLSGMFNRAPVIVKIGELKRFPEEALPREITKQLQQAMLALADEGENWGE